MTIISPTPLPVSAEELPPPRPVTSLGVAGLMCALAEQLTGVPVTAEERQQVLGLLARTAEAIGATAINISMNVQEETPAGGTLGNPDGSLPKPGQLIQELDVAHRRGCRMRDALQEAALLDVEVAQERRRELESTDVIDGRQALIDSGDLPGPDGAYLSTTQRSALAQLRQTLNERHGVTREALDRIELGDRVVSALDDTLNGGHP